MTKLLFAVISPYRGGRIEVVPDYAYIMPVKRPEGGVFGWVYVSVEEDEAIYFRTLKEALSYVYYDAQQITIDEKTIIIEYEDGYTRYYRDGKWHTFRQSQKQQAQQRHD